MLDELMTGVLFRKYIQLMQIIKGEGARCQVSACPNWLKVATLPADSFSTDSLVLLTQAEAGRCWCLSLGVLSPQGQGLEHGRNTEAQLS